ncbi:MAG: asparagine synthetase B family protein, partial [Adlercreutzia equolifaciens]
PLYYAVEGERILFGSEIKGLITHPRAHRSLNERRLAHWLCMEYLPDEETLFEGVRKLPAGHWLRWRDGRAECGRWFAPRFVPDASRSLEESAEAIEATLRESVAAHAIADVDVGCFLSAGVDSSLVAREAARIMEARTFTIGWGEGRFSELEAAATFARATGLPNEGRILGAEQFFASVPAVQYAMDEPLPNPSAVPLLPGMARVLSGAWAKGRRAVRQPSYYQSATLRLTGRASAAAPPPQSCLRKPTGGAFHARSTPASRAIRLEYNPGPRRSIFWRPSWARARGSTGNLRALFAEIEADEITAMQTADILTWMQQDILLKADKMSMASSLELRVPFLDREVFALASTLPVSQRVGRRETKIALRAAAARTLPQATAAMPKQGFVTPLAQWLQEEPWHSQVREVLNGERARRFFRTDRLNALLDEHQRGARSHMKKIWSAYCFLIWHEQYFS